MLLRRRKKAICKNTAIDMQNKTENIPSMINIFHIFFKLKQYKFIVYTPPLPNDSPVQDYPLALGDQIDQTLHFLFYNHLLAICYTNYS